MTIPLRIFIGVISGLIGLVFFPMMIVTVIMAWGIYKEVSDPPELPKVTPASEASPLTINQIQDQSESPAETDFLNALIKAYNLMPAHGELAGSGLRLRSQVKIARYRIDFLVDGRLIVEIDGAAWHSSKEAVERDRIRDRSLKDRGYTVLRIPAKVALYYPDDAVALVEAARAQLPKDDPVDTALPATKPEGPSKPVGIKDALSTISKGIDHLDKMSKQTHERIVIENILKEILSPMGEIVPYALEYTALKIEDSEYKGVFVDNMTTSGMYRDILQEMEAATSGEKVSTKQKASDETLDARLGELRKIVLREDSRRTCSAIIDNIVDEHLKNLAEAQRAILPGASLFDGHEGEIPSPRERIVSQLWSICFDGSNHDDFVHPYSSSRDFVVTSICRPKGPTPAY